MIKNYFHLVLYFQPNILVSFHHTGRISSCCAVDVQTFNFDQIERLPALHPVDVTFPNIRVFLVVSFLWVSNLWIAEFKVKLEG